MKEIQKVIDDYLEYLKNSYSEKTYRTKKCHVKKFITFLNHEKIEQFSSESIDKLTTFFNLQDKKTMRQKLQYEVGSFFTYLVEKNIVDCNPLSNFKKTAKLKTDKMKNILGGYIKYVKKMFYSEKTLRYRTTYLKNFFLNLEKQKIDDFNKISMNNIGDFLSSIGHIGYRRKHLKELQKLFIYLVETHIIKKNPFGNLRVDIDFNKLPDDLQYYFTEYLKTKRSYRINLRAVLKLFYHYFIKNNLCSIENLKDIHIKKFAIFLQNLKNYNGYYKKGTKKKYLLILKKWFTWLLEEKGFTNIGLCINQLDKILQGYDKEKVEKYILQAKDIKLLKDFSQYEKLRGYKLYRESKYLLKPFFKYLYDRSLELNNMRHREGQEYQTYLTTLIDKDGNFCYSTSSVLSILDTTCNFYKYLKTKKIVYSNPFLRIKRIKTENYLPRNLPVEEELKKILDNLKCFWEKSNLTEKKNYYKLHVIAEVMYATGMRISEVSNLEVEDIDFNRHVILIRESKTNRERIAYLNEYAGNVLKIYVEDMRKVINEKTDSIKVFGTKNSLYGTVNKGLKKLSTKYHNFTSHSFRHCVGYHLLKNGCDLRYIQLILGHESLKSTVLYTKIDKKDLRSELDNYHPRTFIKA